MTGFENWQLWRRDVIGRVLDAQAAREEDKRVLLMRQDASIGIGEFLIGMRQEGGLGEAPQVRKGFCGQQVGHDGQQVPQGCDLAFQPPQPLVRVSSVVVGCVAGGEGKHCLAPVSGLEPQPSDESTAAVEVTPRFYPPELTGADPQQSEMTR